MQIAAKGMTVNVHQIREATPKEPPSAGPYMFSPPGCMGKPIGGMRRFLKKVEFPAGMPYVILTGRAGTPARTRRPGGCPLNRRWPSGSASAPS
jgi:hypothetical protein